jgi:hypothetical protein
MANRWDEAAIEYTDTDRIRTALVGRAIVGTSVEGTDYDRVISFHLDDGTQLKAHATDGGCGCSNGCFSVAPGNTVRGTITNVEVKEFATDWSSDPEREIEPGSISDGSATIKIFVYGELGEQLLVSSEGGDNGYYGWGFWLSVEKPEQAA